MNEMGKSIYKNRLAALRSAMAKRKLDACIIPITDPHLSEYVPEYWRVIEWLTGFTGSAATVVVTKKFAGLWTDSRYFIQAERQLEGTGFTMVKLRVPHTPEYIDWLAGALKSGSRIGVDGRVISVGQARLLKEKLSSKKISLSFRSDLITPIWQDRPPMPDAMAFEHPVSYAGLSRRGKISLLNEKMKDMGVDYQLLTSVDDVMWLLNIRGGDVPNTPLLTSFALAGNDQVLLFAGEEKIPGAMKAALDLDGVVLLPYETITPVLSSLDEEKTILYTPGTTSAAIFYSLPAKMEKKEDVSIVTRLKAVKNDTEINNIREVMVRDGVALTKFFMWLEENVGKDTITELSASARLEAFRREQEGCMGPSFTTIAAFNDHAASPHYSPSPDTDVVIGANGIFLLDSGGQYFGGTTDITRTIALGKPGDRMKTDFTLALRGTIDLAMASFPYGTKGYQIEMLARQALWSHGLNYGHGTGHGVGYFLSVHEGPQTIGSGASGDLNTFITPGMLTSDEPAIYREGEYGFRTENLVLCVEDKVTEYGKFLRFETVTLCYIDTTLVDVGLLSDDELRWLNDYHSLVYEKLSGRLNSTEKKWLKAKTARLNK
ncbi:MAG TPA: aminopeptidase P family protein [Bacteroidales bacterium]|nr:aminopeptidase P family protein [Bacteroidales bacterium]